MPRQQPPNVGSHARPIATLALSVLAASEAGCATTSTYAVDPVAFEDHEIVIGSAPRQTVLTGFFLGNDVAELAVTHIDENDERRLRVYAFDDGVWAPALEATLRPGVSFVDVATVHGLDRMITYEPGALRWFDPASATERELMTVTSDFNPPPRGEVPHVDVTHDVNGDGRDDLVVPVVDGFRVFVQTEGGAFADPVTVGTPLETERVYGADGYRYDPWSDGRRVHEMDYDRDGRTDLVYWNEDHFEVHRQDERGRFAQATTTFTTDVTFDSDELASLAAPQEVRSRRRDHGLERALSGSALHTITDVNGDGVGDLVVFSLQSGEPGAILGYTGALMQTRFAYEVHFGAPTADGGTAFAPDVDTAIAAGAIPFGVEPHDFDQDGQLDAMVTSIDPDPFMIVGSILGAMLTQTVSFDLELYRMDDSAYPARPSAAHKIKVGVPPVESGAQGAFFPAVLVGDVNGDGRSDLLLQNGRKQLRVFAGVPGPDLFTRRPQKVAVDMPADEEYTWLFDVDRDGRQDVLMHHASTTEPHRVTMLIAR